MVSTAIFLEPLSSLIAYGEVYYKSTMFNICDFQDQQSLLSCIGLYGNITCVIFSVLTLIKISINKYLPMYCSYGG